MVISVSVLPSRLPHTEPLIRSLKDQDLPIYVWVPRYVKRLDATFSGQIPSWMDFVNFEVVDDIGPASKLLYGFDVSETVITADDDNVYGDGWAQDLIDGYERNPGCAVAYRGRVFTDKHYNHTECLWNVKEDTPVDIITGTHGALYSVEMFDDSIFDEWEIWPLNDDLVFSTHLKRRDIKRLVIPRNCRIRSPKELHSTDALFDINRAKNDEGLGKLGWWDLYG